MDDVTVAHYYAGLIGLALLRQWYVDGTTNEARLAELEAVLAHRDKPFLSLPLNPSERGLAEGYAEWAGSYDGDNPMIAAEEFAIVPILRALSGAGGDALDAACGTGRHAALLASMGWTTTGVDQSPAMLEVARGKVAGARFEVGDVRALPLADESYDLAVAALALCHLDDPTPAVVDVARVLRPGGVFVISDPHPFGGAVGGQAFYGGIVPGRAMSWVRNHTHGASTWMRAFRVGGLEVVDCQELPYNEGQIASDPVFRTYPATVRAALEGLPSLWVWVLRKPGG
jgi:SAM-dependent methyltransferase